MKGDDKESKNEDISNNTELVYLKDVLPSITRHRALASELGNTTLMNLLAEVEKEYENVIINTHHEEVLAGAHIRILQEYVMMK